jgi:hypothetical protein
MKAPKIIHVCKLPPKGAQLNKIISEELVGKMQSSHLYGNKPEIHTVPIHIPISMLLS